MGATLFSAFVTVQKGLVFFQHKMEDRRPSNVKAADEAVQHPRLLGQFFRNRRTLFRGHGIVPTRFQNLLDPILNQGNHLRLLDTDGGDLIHQRRSKTPLRKNCGKKEIRKLVPFEEDRPVQAGP